MAYKYSFADNEIYGASDINAITKRLVTSGIEDSFADGTAYNVSNLNEAGKLLYTSGVVPESCLTLKVVSSGEGKILINPGLAFFDDGSVIEIEDGGEEMSYVAGTTNYVYLKNDLLNTNVSYPYCGTEVPEGDYVLLAEIDESGTITDKRTYAKGKLPGYQSYAGQVLYFNETIEIKVSDSDAMYANGSATFDIGTNDFQYILVADFRNSADYPKCLSIYRVSDGKTMGAFENNYAHGYVFDSPLFCHPTTHSKGMIEFTTITLTPNGKLELVYEYDGYNYYDGKLGASGSTVSIPIKLIFF